jgi:hypothetical protein
MTCLPRNPLLEIVLKNNLLLDNMCPGIVQVKNMRSTRALTTVPVEARYIEEDDRALPTVTLSLLTLMHLELDPSRNERDLKGRHLYSHVSRLCGWAYLLEYEWLHGFCIRS